MNPIIIAKYLYSKKYDEGNEKDYKYYFFTNIKNERGDKINNEGRCKITNLLYYAENEKDLIKGKEYKLTLHEWNNILNIPSDGHPRFKNPIRIECDEYEYYKKGNRYFKEDKISGAIKEFSYHRGFRF
jgi:hypothetical protein